MNIKNFFILLSFLLILLLVPVTKTLAATRSDLTDCTLKEFCDEKDKTTWVKKVSCRPGTEFPEIKERCDDLSADGLDCRNTGDAICICNFVRQPNSCGNVGGIPDAKQGNVESVFGRINPPAQVAGLGNGEGAITNFIGKIIQLVYVAAGIGFVLMFLWSAFSIIVSGGDKEAIGGARKRITYAIIGLAMLAFAFPIMGLIGGLLGFKFFG